MTVEELTWVLKAKASGLTQGFKKAERDVKESSRGIVRSFTAMKAAVVGVVAYVSARIVSGMGKAVLSMSELAGQGQALEKAFVNLSRAGGESSDKILAALRRGTDGTVSNFKLMQEANRALISGLPASADKMEELARVARGLGQAVGIDAAEAFQRMVRGISKQEIELLDELFGGAVKFNDILKKLGPNADATTKQMAIYNSILRVGKDRVAAMGGGTVTFADKMSQARAQIENVQEAIGRFLIPTLNLLIPIAEQAGRAIQGIFGVDLGPTRITKEIDSLNRQMSKLQVERQRIATSTAIQYTRGGGRGRERELGVLDAQIAQIQRQVEAMFQLEESRLFKAQVPKRKEAALLERLKNQTIEAPEFTPKTSDQTKKLEQWQGDLLKSNWDLGKKLDKEIELTGELWEEAKDQNLALKDLALLFDARDIKIVDSLFKMARALDRLGIGGGMVPDALKNLLNKAGNEALLGKAFLQSAHEMFAPIRSLFGGDQRPGVGGMSTAALRAEARGYEDSNMLEHQRIRLGIPGRLADITDELQRRQEEGTRTFGGASTFTETTGRELVAATNSVLSELQFGHLRNIEEMLAEGIPVRTIGLATKLATDTTSTRRSAGL